MRIALIHRQAVARQVLQRALQAKLYEDVIEFSSIEDLFLSSLQFDVLVVYNDLGHYTNGAAGVREIRANLPDAIIIGVSNRPYADRSFLKEGADAFLLRSGNEVQELVNLIRKQDVLKNAYQSA